MRRRLGLSNSEDEAGNKETDVIPFTSSYSPATIEAAATAAATSGRHPLVIPFPPEKEPIVDPQPSKAELIRAAERLAAASNRGDGALLGWGLRVDTSTFTEPSTSTLTTPASATMEGDPFVTPTTATSFSSHKLPLINPTTTSTSSQPITEIQTLTSGESGLSQEQALEIIARLQAEVEHHRRIAAAATARSQIGGYPESISEPPPLYSPDSS